MSESGKKVFTLTQVAQSIRKTIAERYTNSYWILAEINKLNIYSKSGHAFPELIEKQEGKITAEIRATIWKNDFDRINKNFLNVVNEPLKDGIKVLLLASISYEPKYGLTLVIKDIDPDYSLGEIEREKKETIQQLHVEGVFDKNKRLSIALLPKRIAIISVETSKGYSDFIKVIDKNIFGYHFYHQLFPAVLQGDAAVSSIMRQLAKIKKIKSHFDAVAIIRGGGADAGLTTFNNFQLAKTICTFPLPIFTGIGHSTNLTVAEMVAYQSAITPTELGDFFLQRFHDFAVPVQQAEKLILSEGKRIIEKEKKLFQDTLYFFKYLTKNTLKEKNEHITVYSQRLIRETKNRWFREKETLHRFKENLIKGNINLRKTEIEYIKRILETLNKGVIRCISIQNDQLNITQKHINLVDPMNVVKRGYTITSINGKNLRSIKEVNQGDEITTLTFDGVISSKVTAINTEKKHE